MTKLSDFVDNFLKISYSPFKFVLFAELKNNDEK